MQVRFGFGAGVDPKLHAAFEERFGFPLVEAWAMTETGAGAVICANRLPRRVGESCLGGRARTRNPHRRRCRQRYRRRAGRIAGAPCRRRPAARLLRGLFQESAGHAEAWEGGWFHTGDVVRQEPDGSMFFVDRKKNVIRRSGENIAAVEVESTLMRHPAIKAAAVAAVPDAVRGDEVFACLTVEGEPGRRNWRRRLSEWCLTQLAYYKAPGFIAFVDALPLTATQKIQRGVLKALGRRTGRRSGDRRSAPSEETERRMRRQKPYDGVVLTAPVTVPYVRYSQETAHWWIARALRGALDAPG
jgi:acyl-coenzyme A synthetase/AMP-(fatty) acid ligase